MRVFLASSVYAYRALFRWLTPAQYLFQKTLFPLVQLTFFALVGLFGGDQPLSFYLVGNAMVVAFRPLFAVVLAIAEERQQGTLPYLIASPANRVALFYGRATLHVFDGMLDVLLAFGFAMLVFGLTLPVSAWPGLLLAVFVASFAGCSLGFFMGAAAYVVLDALFLANAVMFVLLLVTGANIPLAQLPGALRAVGLAIPLTRTIEAARLYAAGADLLAGLPLLATDLALASAWAIAGFALFSWIETQARRRGTLEGV